MKYQAGGDYLDEGKLLGENFKERMERFGVICENAHHNWDLSDRDENALRTANALLCKQKELLEKVANAKTTTLEIDVAKAEVARFLAEVKRLYE